MTDDAKNENGKVGENKEVAEDNGAEVKLEEYKSWSDLKSDDVTEKSPVKRKLPPEQSPVLPKKKKLSLPTNAKNAVQTLNEYKPGLEYQVIGHTGQAHAPTFTMAVTLNGVQYTGTAG